IGPGLYHEDAKTQRVAKFLVAAGLAGRLGFRLAKSPGLAENMTFLREGALMTMDFKMVQKLYAGLPGKIRRARDLLARPLTLTEKILYSHLAEEPTRPFERGTDYVDLNPDRVAMQDATAQMALLQFMMARRKSAAVPTTIQ